MGMCIIYNMWCAGRGRGLGLAAGRRPCHAKGGGPLGSQREARHMPMWSTVELAIELEGGFGEWVHASTCMCGHAAIAMQ